MRTIVVLLATIKLNLPPRQGDLSWTNNSVSLATGVNVDPVLGNDYIHLEECCYGHLLLETLRHFVFIYT